MSDKLNTTENDYEIEARVRSEYFDLTPIRLRVPGAYEIVALLRIIDDIRDERGRD